MFELNKKTLDLTHELSKPLQINIIKIFIPHKIVIKILN
jgi:hypothetical protein